MGRTSAFKKIFSLGQLLLLAACAPDQVQKTTGKAPATDRPKTEQRASIPPEPAPPAGSAFRTDAEGLALGQRLFQANCAPCHSFRQREIGPNLAGVTAQVSPAWLKQFIRNAPEMIKNGDERATSLYAEYRQVMPPFPSLTDTDLDALLAFIHSQQNTSSAATEAAGALLKDPIPPKISMSGLTLNLEEVVQVPPSAEKIPVARINKMLTLPGKKDRLFIQDLRGKLYELEGQQVRVFMDIGTERPAFIHTPGLATGFGSFAFHPDFARNGLMYTTHTEKAGSAPADFAYADSIPVALQWVLTEWKVKDPGAAVFSGSGREMMRVNMVTQVHGVQEITFNPLAKPGSPDYGLLYIGVGDGGAAGAGYPNLLQDKKRVWGSVLRINPLGANSRNGRYGIPADNPFAREADPQTVGEVFARGFRNPNRISWAPDGRMLITDIGQTNVEEVNIGKAGANYGWPVREGTFLLSPKAKLDFVYALPVDDPSFQFTYPVAQFDHDEGNAISGGFVYTGNKVPLLKGKYIFGDIVSGRIFFVESGQLEFGKQTPIQELKIEVAGKEANLQDLSGSKKTDLRFGLGPREELYLFTKADGRIYRVTDGRMDKGKKEL